MKVYYSPTGALNLHVQFAFFSTSFDQDCGKIFPRFQLKMLVSGIFFVFFGQLARQL